MKLDKETLKKITRKLTADEKASVALGPSYWDRDMEPGERRALYERVYPKIDETWWMFREQIIAGIEGFTGTLSSVKWRDVSSEDMQKILVVLQDYMVEGGIRSRRIHVEDLYEKAMWCQNFEEEFGNPKERQNFGA